jgi:hypothetical protein
VEVAYGVLSGPAPIGNYMVHPAHGSPCSETD